MACEYFVSLLPSGPPPDVDLRVEGSGRNWWAPSGPRRTGRPTQRLVFLCKRSQLAKGLCVSGLPFPRLGRCKPFAPRASQKWRAGV